jgi:hypothetical protein
MIRSQEEANKYVDEVLKKLDELSELSQEAGLFSHAGVWVTIAASFCSGPEEFDRLKTIMEAYLDKMSLRASKNSFMIPSPGTNTIQ